MRKILTSTILTRGLIVLSRFHKEIGMACSINKRFRQYRRNTVKFRNTHDLFDKISRVLGERGYARLLAWRALDAPGPDKSDSEVPMLRQLTA